MDFTFVLSVQHNLSPFVILDQDKDRVIMLINYFIEKGDKTSTEKKSVNPAQAAKSRDDGFWDF